MPDEIEAWRWFTMASDLYQPFITYNSDFDRIRPSVGLVESTYANDSRIVERYDNIAASGMKHSHTIGSRRILRVQFHWQDSTLKDSWYTWWDAVKNGAVFTYHDDDSYVLCGTPTCGDGTICGELSTQGATDRQIKVTVENTDFEMTEMQVDGFWQTPVIEMRVVA